MNFTFWSLFVATIFVINGLNKIIKLIKYSSKINLVKICDYFMFAKEDIDFLTTLLKIYHNVDKNKNLIYKIVAPVLLLNFSSINLLTESCKNTTHVHANICINTHAYACALTRAQHTYSHVYIYIYIYICLCVWRILYIFSILILTHTNLLTTIGINNILFYWLCI